VFSESVPRRFSLIGLVVLLAGCGGDATGPVNKPGIRVIAGAAITDTVDAAPLQALVVEVRGDGGRLVSGAVVRFQSQPPSDTARRFDPAIFVCALTVPTCSGSEFVTDTTDAAGRAKVAVRMGHVAGRAVVLLTVPELGVEDSAAFTVTPGAASQMTLLPRDTVLDIGGTATIKAHLADRYGNARSEVPTLSAGSGNAITLDVATKTVTARDMGTQTVYARTASLIDSTVVSVVPPGRLVVWSSALQVVRLVDINGKGERTLITNVHSDFGVFPHFEQTRQRVTLHSGAGLGGGPSNNAIVIDTTGAPRRDISGFSQIITVRQTNDGNVMVVGRRPSDTNGYYVFRVTADNTITLVAALTGVWGSYAGPDTYGAADITYDGSRVAYITGTTLNVLNISSGTTTTLDQNARSPRWSVQGDRLVYLVNPTSPDALDGAATVINADGTGRTALASYAFSPPGLAWSPDGKYVIGRTAEGIGLRILRVSDGAQALVRFTSNNQQMDYYQPDWR
jgi:hypothetical protein